MESITNIDYSNNNDMSEDCLHPQNERIMGKISYLFAWLGGCVSIGTFTMGSSLIGTINIFQAVIAMILGCTITAIGLMLNGKAGHKYGISFTVQTRSAFGVKGSKIAGIIRAGIADPINVFSSAVDNKGLVIITLIFIAFAQVTTNILNNIIPPAYVIMDAFKVSYKKSIIIVGILSFFTFPWLLVKPESATGLQLFVQIYSAFLGPIFTVLIVDYFILKKQNLEIDELYNENG
ncbi:MAG: nucleobase:cation symporter, family, partial [Clostridium butyricum]|nr:nucleobase:cation symporter, family [Clostridium butyricum]